MNVLAEPLFSFVAVSDWWSDTRRVSEIVGIAREHGLFTTASRAAAAEADPQADEESEP